MTRTPSEVIAIIERFLSRKSIYPQEWNDFIERPISDPMLDVYRDRAEKRNAEFEPRPGIVDWTHQPEREAAACEELENIVAEIRAIAGPSAKSAR